MRRLSAPRPYATYAAAEAQPPPLVARLVRLGESVNRYCWRLFVSLSPIQRVAFLLGLVVLFTLGVLALTYSHRIFTALGPIAKSWRALPGGWIIIWLVIFVAAFPPLIGYSTAVTVSGFVFGFPWGWPIAATATVVGSTAAFYTSRGVAAGYVHRLVGMDKRFVALGQVLRRDGLGVLAMIRLCPLPYSLSNGFLATVPSIRVTSFAAATAMATYVTPHPPPHRLISLSFYQKTNIRQKKRPKLLVLVFIGSRLADLAESGDKMSGGSRAINYISMLVGGLLGFSVGFLIYRRTMARAAELAREEAALIAAEEGGAVVAGVDGLADDDYDGDLQGPNAQLLGGAGAVGVGARGGADMDDDDISLWETDPVDGGYRDSWDDEQAAARGTGLR